MNPLSLFGACLGLVVVVRQEESAAPPPLELRSHARLSDELHGIASAHAGLAEVLMLGTSRGGRALEALRLAGAGHEAERSRPAILLVANVDGARVYASAVALHHARALSEGYGTDPKITALLDSTTIYVVPRANPDTAEARFATPRFEAHASGPGIDDDRDGRQGEDPPADLDGDGVIAWIRVADPDGEWCEDPTDSRALVKADRVKGERGKYLRWPEGRDLDRDERVAEDALLDARVDRNFPAGWDPHTREAGVFPTDEPETRALCDFVLAHPEIGLVVVYDERDSLVAEIKSVGDEAPSVKRIPPEGILESDAKLLGELGKRYRKITASTAKAEGSDAGTFSRWCYEHRGLLTLSATLWELPLEEKKDEKKKDGEKSDGDKSDGEKSDKEDGAGEDAAEVDAPAKAPEEEKLEAKNGKKPGQKDDEPKPSDDAKRLKWIDGAGPEEAWRFRAWTAFEHPELGAVEIGGLAPFARLEPPAQASGAIAAKHLEWFLTLGELLPRVRIAECTRETLGPGLLRVTVVLQNDAYLPLLSRAARRSETIRPAKVRLLLPEAGQRLGGKMQELVEDLPGSGGRQEYTWLIQGPAAMELAVSVETTHAGSVTSEVVPKTAKTANTPEEK